MTVLLIALLFALPLGAAKRPVTLDTLSEHHAHGPGEAAWAPDGRRFAYFDGSKLMLRDATAAESSELLDIGPLQKAAIPVPEERQFNWRNRHVRAETIDGGVKVPPIAMFAAIA